jgi:class 3 adenylate cyclase/tetratricopeptide (TPR) repeat protein
MAGVERPATYRDAGQEQPGATLTIMFEDLEGSTAFAAAYGDQAWRKVQLTHDRLVRAELEAREAIDVVFLGDGYLVAFASASQALGAAVGIQQALLDHGPLHPDQELRVRIGLHTGEVSHDERGHLVGTAVHAASRITGKADGGQVFASHAVRDAAEDDTFADRGLFWLKGFPERWRLYELLWQDPSAGQAAAPTMHLIGRDAELADLRRGREQAEAGHGGLALIAGEPGVGKTSLAEVVMAEARTRGATTLAGHCYQMEAPPYISFVEILETAANLLPPDTMRDVLRDAAPEVARIWPALHRLLPGLPAPLDLPPEQARRYLFTNLADVLDRLSRLHPLVLLLDDLQWADQAALLFLHHLTQRLDDMPVLLLGTYRDIDVQAGLPFADALVTLLRHPDVHRVTLRRLTREAVAQVLDGLADREPPPRLVDVVYRTTEGNPLFVEEVFHHLAEEGRLFDANGDWQTAIALDEVDVPQGVRLLLSQRLARLSPATQRVLATAAVAGRGVGLRLLARLEPEANGELLDALDEAERAHLVTFADQADDTGLRFSHELIRQTLLSGMPTLRRRRMHARVAEELEALRGGDDVPAELAYHLLQAGPTADAAKALHFLQRAGDRAMDAAAFEEALRHFEQGLALQPSDRMTRADLEFGLGRALRSLGRWDEAVERWKEAIDTYEKLGDQRAAGRASWYAAEQLSWIARWDEAIVVAGGGLAALGDVVNADRARLTANAAVMFSAGGYKEAADQMLAEAEGLADELDDPGLLGYILNLRTVHHYFYGQPRLAATVGLRSAELLRAAGDLWNLANVLSFVALDLAFTIDFERTNRIGAEAYELADRLGHFPARWLAHRSTWIEIQTGELERLERFAERDMELIQGLPWTSGALVLAGIVAFRRGRWEEAIQRFHEALDQEVAEALRGGDVAMLFLAYAYIGDRDRAMPLYAEQAPTLTDFGDTATIGAMNMLTTAVEGLWVLGEKAEAARHYPSIASLAGNTGNAVRTWDARLVETLAGIAAAGGREWMAADRHFATALEVAEQMPHLTEQADVRRFSAQMLMDRAGPGDLDRARELLTQAVDGYHRLGMPRHEAMTVAILRQVGPMSVR